MSLLSPNLDFGVDTPVDPEPLSLEPTQSMPLLEPFPYSRSSGTFEWTHVLSEPVSGADAATQPIKPLPIHAISRPECAVCRRLPVDAYTGKVCGHMLCVDCKLQSDRRCSSCHRITTFRPDFDTRRMLQKVPFRAEYRRAVKERKERIPTGSLTELPKYYKPFVVQFNEFQSYFTERILRAVDAICRFQRPEEMERIMAEQGKQMAILLVTQGDLHCWQGEGMYRMHVQMGSHVVYVMSKVKRFMVPRNTPKSKRAIILAAPLPAMPLPVFVPMPPPPPPPVAPEMMLD